MTRRELREYAARVGKPLYCVPYATTQTLDRYAVKIGYNSGVYGWNWDAYEYPNMVLCTGYRNLTGTDLNESYMVQLDTVFRKIVSMLETWDKQRGYFHSFMLIMNEQITENAKRK